ncbi:MAG: glycosyltransferase [Hungatella sp.]|nr:glycosyltransferase [Hungatella sp.]
MADKEKNFVSAVIYIHNAEKRAEAFLKTIIGVLEENFRHSEIICVNDASGDNSVERIKQVGQAAESTSITVISMSYFHGLELAMNAGVDMAIGDFVFEFDNTVLDFAPSVVMDVYRRSLAGFDIVSASPDRRERFSSRLFYRVFDRFTNLSYHLSTESFRVLSRRVINRISSMNKAILYRKAIYANCGLKTDNIRYQAGVGDMPAADIQEKHYRAGLAADSLILFTELGYRFSIGMTAAMMLISLCMIIYSVAVYAGGHPVEGWTTTILFFSAAFLGLFGILTIIVKYLQLLIDIVFKRRHYSFESIEKIT